MKTLVPALFAALASTAAGQTLAVDDLIAGATAEFAVTGAAPGDLVAFAVGFSGLGPGLCFDGDTCLDLLGLPLVVGSLPVGGDGSAILTLPLSTSIPTVPAAVQAILVGAGPGGVALQTTNAWDGAIGPVGDLSDPFDDPGLADDWQLLHPELGSIAVENGALVIEPGVGGLPDMWFDDGEGMFVYREVTGDFELTTEVRVHAPGDLSQSPSSGFRLGGLLLRDPTATAPGNHDWCHVATGSGGSGVNAGVEWKQTLGSVSDWAVDPAPDTHRELRLVRAGQQVTLWQRDPGGTTWALVRTFDFTALPATVQVGAMAYAFLDPPQVVARFEYLRFAP